MRMDDKGALPLLVIVVILGILLLFGGVILAYLTMKMWLTLLLIGAGLYLLIKPNLLSGVGATGKWAIPLVLIVLGIAVYGGWLSF
jgi:hypothetical protein